MKNNIGSYSIENFANGNVKIDYKRSRKDFFYIIVYFLISLPILYFDFKLFSFLLPEKIDSNVIIGYFFSICILLFALYFLIVSIETFIKPTKNVFFINKSEKQLIVKTNQFRKLKFNFTEIKQFHLGAKDITVTNYNEGSTRKRQLYLIHMHIELLNKKTIKIHQFEGTDILISYSEKKKNKLLKETSKQITKIISEECGKEFYWKGTQKE
ncbi:hypothetical protein [Flavobacterium terrigena]|uniref:Uncharacterized protein n=1 Tax=Flavobacterium terrigena TaxID=402734 RepID=A0A1H6QIW0_9FLAO|nr:hypothetical protein [Flavobacterium terrigena]SEI38862.1 hypothetical protein SAMN05660918_0279 [Flavobacterium terrigena]